MSAILNIQPSVANIGTIYEGYTPGDHRVLISVTNDVGITVTWNGTQIGDYFYCDDVENDILPGDTYEFYAYPKAGLLDTSGAGTTYLEQFTVNTSAGVYSFRAYAKVEQSQVFEMMSDYDELQFTGTQGGFIWGQELTISNTGNQPLENIGVTVTGDFESDTSSFSLEAGESYTIMISAFSDSVGTNTGSARIFDASQRAADVVVSLVSTITSTESEIIATPASLDFGTISEGGAIPLLKTVSLRNDGEQSEALTFTAGAGYMVTPQSATIPAGSSFTIGVRPTENTAGIYNSNVTVSGLASGDTVVIPCAYSVLSYEIATTPGYLHFGEIPAGETGIAQTVTVKNIGTGSQSITGYTSNNFNISAVFPITLAPGQETQISVQPRVKPLGEYSEVITLNGTNAFGFINGDFSVIIPAQSTLEPSVAFLDFGKITEGGTTPSAKSFNVVNTGNASASILLSSPSGYSVSASSATIPAGQSVSITVTPTASAVGNYADVLTVTDTGGTSYCTVALLFEIAAFVPVENLTISPNVLNFGVTVAGDEPPSAKTITVKNTGNVLTTATITAPTGYSVSPSFISLAAGGETSVTITPTATQAGEYNSAIIFTTGEGNAFKVFPLWRINPISTGDITAVLYNVTDSNEVVSKNLGTGTTVYGVFRTVADILKPTIDIEMDSAIGFNYCYLAEFGRYYYIVGMSCIRTGLWRLQLRVDVLKTYSTYIRGLGGVVSRNENDFNPNIADSRQAFENKNEVEKISADVALTPLDLECGELGFHFHTVGMGGTIVTTSSYMFAITFLGV